MGQGTPQTSKKGIRLVPEGRRIFAEHTVEENMLLGAHVERKSKKIRDLKDEMFERFPRLKERRSQRHAVRGRTTDACHRKGFDVGTGFADS